MSDFAMPSLPELKEMCSHCFGFGRLPVPSWYREQGGER